MDGEGNAEQRYANWCERENMTLLLAQNGDAHCVKTA